MLQFDIVYEVLNQFNQAKQYVFQNILFKELRGEVWQFSSNLVCFLNGQLLGDEKDLASWAEGEWQFTLIHPDAFYAALTGDYYVKHLHKTQVRASRHDCHITYNIDIKWRSDTLEENWQAAFPLLQFSHIYIYITLYHELYLDYNTVAN